LIDRDAADQQRADAQRQRDDRSFDDRTNVGERSRGDRDSDLRAGIEFGRRTDRGLAINNIERNSFYYDSGFRRGDIIVSVHGRPVYSDADFVRFMVIEPGQRVPVIVLRDGRRQTIYVQYQDVAHTHHHIDRDRYQAGGAYLGVVFDAQARDAAVVLSVNPGSPAQEAGIQSGDIIVALNGQEMRSYMDVIAAVREMRPGEELQLIVERARAEREMLAVLDAKPNVRTAGRPDVRVERETTIVQPRTGVDAPYDDRYRDDDRYREDDRLLDRDRNYDGNRRLLPRLRN
jgi:S1-C subfamily serine protease